MRASSNPNYEDAIMCGSDSDDFNIICFILGSQFFNLVSVNFFKGVCKISIMCNFTFKPPTLHKILAHMLVKGVFFDAKT